MQPETIRAQLRRGEFIAAYAEAAAWLSQNPADYSAGLLLVDAAFCVERPEDAAALLADLQAHIPAQAFSILNLQLSIFAGDSEGIQHYWQTAGLTAGSVLYHELAYRIALWRHDLADTLAQLDALERLGGRPLEHFFAKFEILKQQGRYDVIADIVHQLMAQTAPELAVPRWQLQLAQALVAHDELRFQDSLALSQTLIDSYLAAPIAQQPPPAPPAKPWTRRRQHQVMADLERIILLNKLPVCLAAGSLLALAREGDFFPSDKDIDLAVMDANLEEIAQIMAATGFFDDISPPGYFSGFKIMRHRRTGFVVDLTQYQRTGAKRIARWRHSSGPVLREAVFPDFGIGVWDHPTLRCRVPVPDAPERYLDSMYGDWRTPDPLFDTVIAAHNLTGLTDFLISLAHFRIANALIVGARQSAQALVRHLQNHGLQSELFERIHALP